MENDGLIQAHGGYRTLKSFQLAQLAYDFTMRFCGRYIEKRSRTHDQMVQAARSGVQNIAEGSQASGTSKKMELKLTNVARASLEELRLDYEDFLRHRQLKLWDHENPLRRALVARRCATADEVALWIQEVHDGHGRYGLNGPDGQATTSPKSSISTKSIQATKFTKSTKSIESISSIKSIPPQKSTYPEIAANAALVLIGVACSLLDRQIAAQAKSFEEEGGFTERLYRVRSARRKNKP